MNPMEKFLGKTAPEKEPLVEDEASEAGGKISFSMPAGFKVPDGVKDGEAFDAMATLKVEDGKLVLSELDGTPVDDEPMAEEEDMESEPSDMEEEGGEPESPDSDSEETDSGLGFLDAIEKKAPKRKM